MEYRVLETRSADILTKYYSNEIDSFLNACHEDILWIGPAEKHVIRTREGRLLMLFRKKNTSLNLCSAT